MPSRITRSATSRSRPSIPDAAAKLLCVGINYLPHIKEMGRERPERPVLFVRFGDSVVGHGQPLQKPRESEQFDFEGELAVIIGKRARRVSRRARARLRRGLRLLQRRQRPRLPAALRAVHARQEFPCERLVRPVARHERTRSPIRASSRCTTRLNGAVMQHESVGELCFDVPQLIEYCSIWTQLEPGDVIVTGTPGGVGAGANRRCG